MKRKKVLTLLLMGMIFASGITFVKAYSPYISFTSTSAYFELENRPNNNDLKIDCYYRYKNVHGSKRYKNKTTSHYGVIVNNYLYTDNADWGSDYAEMTSFINGKSYGTISKYY